MTRQRDTDGTEEELSNWPMKVAVVETYKTSDEIFLSRTVKE